MRRPSSESTELLSHWGLGIDELELMTGDGDEPRLSTPEIEQILRTAGIDAIPKAGARGAVLVAMRKAAENRLAGVTDQKRRRHYGHAAELVSVCLGCDRSPDTARWVESMRTEYQRFPALRAEIDRALGSS